MWDILPGLHSKVAAAFQACMVCSDKQTIPNQSQRTTSKRPPLAPQRRSLLSRAAVKTVNLGAALMCHLGVKARYVAAAAAVDV